AVSPGMPLPVNVLVWDYPELGMKIKLQDRLLNGFYQPELVVGSQITALIEPRPDPDSLARHPELVGTGEGRAVFHTLPPSTRPLPVAGTLAGFESERGPRLLASV